VRTVREDSQAQSSALDFGSGRETDSERQTQVDTRPMTITKTQLTPEQSARKAELEQIVAQHIHSFRIAGEALAEIWAERLWEDEFDSFKDYLGEKWGMSQSRAYQLIDAARVAKTLPPMVEIKSERAIRPLTKLKPKQQEKVVNRLAKVARKKKITATIVEAEVVKELPRGGLAAQIAAAKAKGIIKEKKRVTCPHCDGKGYIWEDAE
jgi:hypothetical protein